MYGIVFLVKNIMATRGSNQQGGLAKLDEISFVALICHIVLD
jgi:hypothetical protein